MGKQLLVLAAATHGNGDDGLSPQALCRGNRGLCPGFSLVPEGEGPFVAPGPESNLHHESLDRLANGLNLIVKGMEGLRQDKTQKIGFVQTELGILLLWKVEVPESGGDRRFDDQDKLESEYEDVNDKSDHELAEIFDLNWGRQT